MIHVIRWVIAIWLLVEVGIHSHWSVLIILVLAFLKSEAEAHLQRRSTADWNKFEMGGKQ